jgi:hypothetical protein
MGSGCEVKLYFLKLLYQQQLQPPRITISVRILTTYLGFLRFAIHVAVEVDMMIPSEAKVGRYTTKDSNLSIS